MEVTVSLCVVLPASARGGTSQREGQSRAVETRARATGAEGGRGTAGQKEGEVGKYLTETLTHCVIPVEGAALISKVPPYRATVGFHKSLFLLQRLEEIMRRTRRTDSADMVKSTVGFLKMTLPLGPHDAYPEPTDKYQLCSRNQTVGPRLKRLIIFYAAI